MHNEIKSFKKVEKKCFGKGWKKSCLKVGWKFWSWWNSSANKSEKNNSWKKVGHLIRKIYARKLK